MKKLIIALGLAAFALPVFAQDTTTTSMPEDTTMPSMPQMKDSSQQMSDSTNMNTTDTSAAPIAVVVKSRKNQLVAFVQNSPAALKSEAAKYDETPAYTEGE